MTAARPYIPRPGERAPVSPRFKQSRTAELRIWWREIDRVLLALTRRNPFLSREGMGLKGALERQEKLP